MVTAVLFGLISVSGLAVGLVMIVTPSLWSAWVTRTIEAPVSRFVLAQSGILAGLILVVGTARGPAAWLWGSVGGLVVASGMLLLGVPERLRVRLLGWYRGRPQWISRLLGFGLVTLATLLGIDIIRGGP